MGAILPTNDLLFKKTFSSVENKDILQGCIADFFGITVPLDDIEIVTPYSIEAYQEAAKDGSPRSVMRQIQRDIRASLRFADFISDMQVKNTRNFTPRTLLYAFQQFCDNYNALGQMGMDRYDNLQRYSSLRPVYALNILKESHFDDEDALRIFTLYDAERGKRLAQDWVKIGYFELNKKNYETVNHGHWRNFFRTGEAASDAPEYIKKAANVASVANLSKTERDVMTRVQWIEDTIQDGMQSSYEDGKDEGRVEGRAEGRAEGIDIGINVGEARGENRILDMVSAGYSAEQIAEAIRARRESGGMQL
jgi:hypothetical protein